jgi:hypothetical protein
MKRFVLLLLAIIATVQLKAQYPTATGDDTSWENISNVSFANLNNSSSETDADGDNDEGYDFFDDTVCYINTNKTYTLSVSITPDANDYVYVWIDWNQDQSFSNTTERYILASNTSSSGPFTTNITVPSTATTGQTRMRVVLRWNQAPSSTGNQGYGEVEDYIVNVSKFNYVYLGGWNASGLPDYLEPVNDYVDQSTMDLIDAVLPESTPNLDYIDYNDYLNVTVDTGTRIWASFIYEGAGWKNSFAMYQYDENDEPNSPSDIDSLTIIFPNVSGTGSGVAGGGSLIPGHKVFYDSVSAGTTVAFAVIARGFDNTHTNTTIDNQGNYIHYSNNNLNQESVDSLKAHNVTFWDANQEKYILGFEDIDRESGSCDQDFNDVLFYITLDPVPLFDQSGGSNNQPPDIEDPEGSTLPVEWLGFEGKRADKSIVLQWYIASQYNNDYFIIERSTDMLNFEEIGMVDGHGTTSQLIRYTHIDYQPITGEAYYRIKQVDFDGTSDYSQIISVKYQAENQFMAVFPNPVNDNWVNVRTEGLRGNIHIQVMNASGQIISMEDFSVQSDFTKRLNISDLKNGLYYIRINDANHSLQKKVLVQR